MGKIFFLRANILLIAAVLIIGIAMSFNVAKSKSTATVHYYVSSSMSPGAFANTANWATANSNGECVTQRDERPCKITVPANSSLSAILSGKNNSQVLDISEGYKPEP